MALMTLPDSSHLPASKWAWVLLACAIVVFVKSRVSGRARRLPPGPKPLPLIGNLFDMPTKSFGAQFRELNNTYGDVVYLNVLGREIISLGSYKAANDLLDKRSAIYSGRMQSIMANMCGLIFNLALLPYGSEWRVHRRTFHQYMNSEVVPQYRPVQTSSTRTLARRLLETPENWTTLVKFSMASSILSIVYDIDLNTMHDDKYFDMFEYIAEVADNISIPGRFMVEGLPWLRFLPSWFPGGGFKTYAAGANDDIARTIQHFFDIAKKSISQGNAKESVVAHLLESLPAGGQERADALDVCKKVCATMYVAAGDTTHAALGAFFHAMTLYPNVQKKAQAELDAVVGLGRLPDYEDMNSLPYLRALIKELLRWHVVTPVGVPHTAIQDDEYNGYTMPEGATIFVNAWAMTRDPDVYPDPENFMPERFLDKDGKYDVQGRDPTKFVFGFGRRICPGRHFAESSLLMTCATVLWGFDISAPIDANGKPVEVKYDVSFNTIISHAKALPYTIKPRSEKRVQVIKETATS